MDLTGIRILGLIGHQGSGKDTVARLMAPHGFESVAFADPLREIMWALDPIVLDDEIPGGYDTYRGIVNQYGYDEAKRIYPDIRRMLQALGTDGMRKHLGEDVWVRAWEHKAEALLANRKGVVTPDVRFQNEIDAIHEAGGVVARVIRPGAIGQTVHESESLVDRYPGSFPIYNDGSLEKLEATVVDAIERLSRMDPVTGKALKIGR